MTYAVFLLVFLVIPIALLALAVRPQWRGRHRLACASVCGLAFAYTAPWDNHAAKIRLWTFDPVFAPPGHFVLFLPWEEYAFYFAQGVFLCLVVTFLARFFKPDSGGREL